MDSRQDMSAILVDKTISAHSTSQLEGILAEIDTQAAQTNSPEQPSWHCLRGPFGIFSAVQSKDTSSQSHQNQNQNQNVFGELLHSKVNQETTGAHANLTIREDLEIFGTEFGQPSFCNDVDMTVGISEVPFGLVEAAGSAYPDTDQLGPEESNNIDQLFQSFSPMAYKDVPNDSMWETWQKSQAVPASISSRDLLKPSSPYLPRCAQYLLWHYAKHTIPSLSATPPSNEKSLWNELHLPTALKAYAELNVLGDSSLPRVSLLYSLLSISSFQLRALHSNDHWGHQMDHAVSGSSFSPDTWSATDWEAQAIKFRNIAQTGLSKYLESFPAASGDKFKYKEVLLAAVNLVCIRVRGMPFPYNSMTIPNKV